MHLRIALCSLIIGLLSINYGMVLPSFWWCGLCLLMTSVAIFSRFYSLGFLVFGFAWGSLFVQLNLLDRLPSSLDGKTMAIEGTVVGLPEYTQEAVRFQIEGNTAEGLILPKRIKLSWYQGQSVVTGERWQFVVRLKTPRGTVNPSSFDYEAWLMSKQIGAIGTVKSATRLRTANNRSMLRYTLRERLLKSTSEQQGAGLVALVLGDGSGITQAQWRILQDTGTVHLMVISGQHISLLAGFLYFLIILLVKLNVWPVRWPWLPFACAISLLGAWGYGYLAGLDTPVQRACLMVTLVIVWRLKFRFMGVLTPFLMVLAACLLWNPLVGLQAGFWLSFTAVAILLLGFTGRLRSLSAWRNLIKAQYLVSIGLLPLLFALLLPISLTAPLANLVAVPLVSGVVVPFALLGTVLLPFTWLSQGCFFIAAWGLKILFVILSWVAHLMPAWIAASPAWWAILFASIGVFILLLPRGVPAKGFGAILCLPLFFPFSKPIEQGIAQVMVVDVGQGLSVLVRTQKHALLYDAGPVWGAFDTGERIIVPLLKRKGITALDTLLISHADNDHSGGAVAIYSQFSVEQVISGEPHKLSETLNAKPCQSGKTWEWDGVVFSLWQWSKANSGNDASCVLLVEAKGERLLLTGDVTAQAEKAWVSEQKDPHVQWLLAPHHGSNTSSSEQILQKTTPINVIISRGWLNIFKHPHAKVILRYNKHQVTIYDTALMGAISINLGQYLPASKQRNNKYFWRHES